MRPIGEEEGVDTHVKTSLMHEIQVTNRRSSNGYVRSCTNTVEYSGDEDTIPGSTMPSDDIRDSGQKISQQINRPSTVEVCQRRYEQWSDASEDDVNSQFV